MPHHLPGVADQNRPQLPGTDRPQRPRRRNLDASQTQHLQRRRSITLIKGDVLGDLELENVGGQPALRQRMLDVIDQRRMAQLRWEKVHGNASQRHSGGPPLRRLGASRFDDPSACLGADRICSERVNERARPENSALRVPPAQQRLGASDGAVGKPDLRLIKQLEFASLVRAPQFRGHTAAGLRLRPQCRREHAAEASAIFFGLVEGKVRI
jgi:hypothetical protein